MTGRGALAASSLTRCRHAVLPALCLVLALLGVLFYAGCNYLSEQASIGGSGSGVEDFGPVTLEERIAGSDAIVRVSLISVTAVAERLDGDTDYAAALDFRFRVLEYLKGSGANELVGVVYDASRGYNTAASARTAATAIKNGRDTRWDDREAIIFLVDNHPGLPSSSQANRYRLGSHYSGRDYYSPASGTNRWLPDQSAGGARGSSGADTRRFLLSEPPAAAKTASGTSFQAGLSTSISLANLTAQVGLNVRAIAAGGGSEAYQDCLYLKLKWEREAKYIQDHYGPWDPGRDYYYKRHDASVGSGLPEGTRAFTDPNKGEGATAPAWAGDFPIIGRDAALFSTNWPGVADTVRPLPAGSYKFYYSYRPKEYILCDGQPDEEKKREEVFVTVTAPTGTVHEALFDPVAIGSAVGADASNGVLEPKAFSMGGVSTALQSLKWQGGTATLGLRAPASLSGHALEFIALDGTVALSLDGGTATVSGSTLTWSVATQPWQAGDLLMLRIRQAGAPAPTATPEV